MIDAADGPNDSDLPERSPGAGGEYPHGSDNKPGRWRAGVGSRSPMSTYVGSKAWEAITCPT